MKAGERAKGVLPILAMLAMLAAGAMAWWLQLRPGPQLDVSPLARLPERVGTWSSRDIPIEAGIEAALKADFNIQRTYESPIGGIIWFYMGYYGTAKGGRPEHIPRGCYTGSGWGIVSASVIDLDPHAGLRVNEYLVERDGERRLVHYWYRSFRRTGMIGGWDQNIDRLLGRILEGRGDGALIRVSTPLYNEDSLEARARLRTFVAKADSLLATHWPKETF